jgi:DNA-binding Xre family transcriptional regulator
MIMKNIVKAMEQSGKTRYKIWQDTGINEAVLHRIFHGGTARIETLEILCKYLGLELMQKKTKEKNFRGKKS